MADFTIGLTMDQDTITYIKQNQYQLYGIKFMTTDFPASPLIWFTDDEFLERTPIQWNKAYEAFISTQLDYKPGTVITAYSSQKISAHVIIPSASSKDINLGQEMIVEGMGALSIQNGQADEIIIQSKTTTNYACGLNQSVVSLPATPLFIAQILSGEIKTMTPLTENVLLMFSPIIPPKQTSTVVDAAFAPGILISLSSIETSREVTWSRDQQWGPKNQNWITEISAGDDLTKLYSI